MLPLLVTAALLAYLVDRFGIDRIAGELAALPLATVLLVTALLAANQLLSCGRFHGVLHALDVRPSVSASLRANIFSIVGGMLFFSFFGQSLARAALLRRLRVTTSVAFTATAIERLISVALLLVIALAGALALSGHVSIDMANGGYRLVAIAVAGLICVVVAIRSGLGRRQRRVLVARLTFFSRKATWSAARWTLVMHATMLLAYTALGLVIEPTLSVGDTLAVSALVMLAASLPVSFAGWGIRELSAAAAFQAIGASPEAGITLGVGIGLLTVVSLLINLLLASLLPTDAGSDRGTHAERPVPGLQRTVAMMLPLMAAVGVLFQIRLPTASGAVNVNLADPIAIVAGIVLVSAVLSREIRGPVWRTAGLGAALAAFSLVLVAGFLNGYFKLGLIDWALYNRLVGWGVLLAFLATGALAGLVAGTQSAAAVCRLFVLGCVVLVMLELLARTLCVPLGLIPAMPVRAEGLAGNPNAFSFQLMLALVALLAGYGKRPLRSLQGANIVYAAILLFGIWLSGSRAAMGTLVPLLLLYWLLPTVRLRGIVVSLVAAILIGLLSLGVEAFIHAMSLDTGLAGKLSGFLSGGSGLFSGRGGYDLNWTHLHSDRVSSIVDGFVMWQQNPLFGAGLGAFITAQINVNGFPLMIHNSPLWAAAEMGLVGLVSLTLIVVVVVRGALKARCTGGYPRWALLAFGVVLVTTTFSMVHDMIYQRPIWLLLGVALFMPRKSPQGGPTGSAEQALR